MPLFAGYAETINAGKTPMNEDQASARVLNIVQQGCEAVEARELDRSDGPPRRLSADDDILASPSTSDSRSGCLLPRIEAAFFGLYDGHAGTGTALMASKCLHEHVKSRLSEVVDLILSLDRESAFEVISTPQSNGPQISIDDLVTGCLETAYVDMDEQVAAEKQVFKITGGCAAISALILLGKIYIANAGDCRAVVVTSSYVQEMSTDFTPASERKRLQELAYRNPELIGSCFSRLQYARRLKKKDLHRKVLYRDWFMDGWASKTVRDSDLRPPLIGDHFKKTRLLNTIGVSRGFGDHHLLTADDRINIKPFLSPVPEVRVFDIKTMSSLTDKDVLIMASDGLWDVIAPEEAGAIVRAALAPCDATDTSRYCMAAQELVTAARGVMSEFNRWELVSRGGTASHDDISVFVVPLKHCVAPPKRDPKEEDDDDMIDLS